MNLPTGNCVICNRFLGRDSYNRQEVVAVMGPEGAIVTCIDHIKPDNKDYKINLEKIALAKIAQLQKG